MRIFSIIVAGLAIVGGVACISVVPKFRAMYEEMGATLPNLTITFLNTSGLMPGGIFLLLAAMLIILVAIKRPRVAVALAIPTLLFLIGTSAILPTLLMKPMSQSIRDADASHSKKDAEQVGTGQPLIRPESE